jgi:hypothetical protein
MAEVRNFNHVVELVEVFNLNHVVNV